MNFRNGEGTLKHIPGEPKREISEEKCKCGNNKYKDQEVCGQCYLKNITKNTKNYS